MEYTNIGVENSMLKKKTKGLYPINELLFSLPIDFKMEPHII